MRYADTLDVNCEPTLIIDVNGAVAKQLADHLNHSGIAADTAVSRSAALAALRAKHYGAMVFVGDVGDPEHLQCIAELRKRALRTWLIMISSTEPHYPRDLFLRYGIDALIVIPFHERSVIPVDGLLAAVTSTMTWPIMDRSARSLHRFSDAQMNPNEAACRHRWATPCGPSYGRP